MTNEVIDNVTIESDESKPVKRASKSKATKPAAKRYAAKDIAAKLAIDPKKTRQLIRDIARSTSDSRFVRTAKRYDFSASEFNAIVRKLEKTLAERAATCSVECTHSTSTVCHCHCEAKNHASALAKSERPASVRFVARSDADDSDEESESE